MTGNYVTVGIYMEMLNNECGCGSAMAMMVLADADDG